MVGLRYGLAPTTPIETLSVEVDEFKKHARILGVDLPDEEIEQYIRIAQDWLVSETDHAIMSGSYTMSIDRFPYYLGSKIIPYDFLRSVIRIPINPVTAVGAISYVDEDGTTKNWTGFQLATRMWPARIAPQRGEVFPWSDPFTLEAINITFTAGYAGRTSVPYHIRQTVKFLAAHFYEMSLAGGGVLNIGNIVNELPFTLKAGVNRMRYKFVN